MLYLESPSTDPRFNLALEEHIFNTVGQQEDCLLLWQNENAVIVGRYQNTAEEINASVVEDRGICVVRRLSGGGAVYHDLGNLNFTLIVSQSRFPDFDFKLFTAPVIETLRRLGVHAAFNGRNDLTIDDKKFSGNAQYVRNGRILHHGCIMVETDVTQVSAALQAKAAKFQSKSIKSVKSRVTTINNHSPSPVSVSQFKSALRACISENEELTPLQLTAADMSAIALLQDTKYSTWEWNYGISPPFAMHREMKFPAGLVSVHLSVAEGHIKSVRFYGDFFGSGDLSELEAQMEGLPLNEHLEQALEALHISHYMNGITATDLCHLLL